MLGESIYRFEADELGETILTKVTHVSLGDVTLDEDEEGAIRITPKDQPQPKPEAPPKYKLVPARDGLYRPVLLRNISCRVVAGTTGGLVSSEFSLSQEGDCWIDYGSEVIGDARVRGNAYLKDTKLKGDVVFSGESRGVRCVMHPGAGRLRVRGEASLVDTQVTFDGDITIKGATEIVSSNISGRNNFAIAGGCVVEADIANWFECLSLYSGVWGWVSAYRGLQGQLWIAAGCQRHKGAESFRAYAEEYGIPGIEMRMLDGFLDMAQAAQAGWRPDATKSQETDYGDHEPVEAGPVGPVHLTVADYQSPA